MKVYDRSFPDFRVLADKNLMDWYRHPYGELADHIAAELKRVHAQGYTAGNIDASIQQYPELNRGDYNDR